MNRVPLVRNLGAACIGTALLGLGCTEADNAQPQRGPLLNDAAPPEIAPPKRKLVFPEPAFGFQENSARTPLKPEQSDLAGIRETLGPAARTTGRRELLVGASDHALIIPAGPVLKTAPDEPTGPDIAFQGAEEEAPVFAAPKSADTAGDAETGAAGGTQLALLAEEMADGTPTEPDAGSVQPDVAPLDEVTPDRVSLPVRSPSVGKVAADFDPDVQTLTAIEQNDRSALLDVAVLESELEVEPGPEAGLATEAEAEAEAEPEPEPEPEPSALVTAGLEASETNNVPQAESGQHLSAMRTIANRPKAEDIDRSGSQVPALAAIIAPVRTPIPMVTVRTDASPTILPEPANDVSAPAPSPIQPSLNPTGTQPTPQSLVLPARTQTTLGLGNSDVQAGSDQSLTSAGENRNFTTSAEPPVLSYQDELILEVKVSGISATDTVLAYGTREGIYLPVGTLARILDLAITVSDDGHYASGWFLDESRRLTIDLRQGQLTKSGIMSELRADSAVAFDGELYLRSDRFTEFLPIKIDASLRSQSITITTLEPFPFETRMAREAERARLASRAKLPEARKWPRQETPWLLGSLPLGDLELRTQSDSAFGPRIESDLRLAGDLAFLTAQAYLSADTRNGLTTSLIEVGRIDPDGKLLGPLKATQFSAGDVSTFSMPIGLRGVTGRGVTITNIPPQTISVFEKIDLRGILPDGFEVELYRNDILVGSTREAANGQYQFLQVPVDFGLNIFRLVFFGPQGQRSEEVRRITVGDGRIPSGSFTYRIGAAQKDRNLLGVQNPEFIPAADYGDWRASAELSYGLSSDITTVLGGAWYETAQGDSWAASAGLRSGLGRFALRGDVAAAAGNAFAFSAGVGGRFGNSAVTVNHVEYSGEFRDETRSIGSDFLRRSTEIDFNSSLDLGNPITGLIIPLSGRLRHFETTDGSRQTSAALRASTRFPGILASNTLEYSRSTVAQAKARSQLFGNFDLATLGRSKTRGRISLGYQLLPQPDIVSAAVEVDHALDERTAVRGSLGYVFDNRSTQIGLSAIRDFEKFTLAFDGRYGFAEKTYSVGLRLGLSFGRDPLRGNFFVARPGLATSGGASLRAFQDMDGDNIFGADDRLLPDVDFIAYNQTAKTGADGIARLSGLGEGNPVSIQIDTTSLPDIALAPQSPGFEIVPRAGRIHRADVPIVALSEVEGTVRFLKDGTERGVSGVRLHLKDGAGRIVSYTKTEIDGYFFFEQVKPGQYEIVFDDAQAASLGFCSNGINTVSVDYEPDVFERDIAIAPCQK